MKLVRENLYNFHKTGDVKGSLNIGKYQYWRDYYLNKPFCESVFYLDDNRIYRVFANYTVENGEDAIYFTESSENFHHLWENISPLSETWQGFLDIKFPYNKEKIFNENILDRFFSEDNKIDQIFSIYCKQISNYTNFSRYIKRQIEIIFEHYFPEIPKPKIGKIEYKIIQ